MKTREMSLALENRVMQSALAPRQAAGLFVTGTDTGVGKTYISSGLLKQWRLDGVSAGAYKPAASGCDFDTSNRPSWSDVDVLADSLGQQFPKDRICPQCFAAPLAPPFAAQEEGRRVDPELLLTGADWWKSRVDLLLVEGAGGLLSPLSETGDNADLAIALGYPLLVVARLGLGTINHTLLTVEAAQRRGLVVLGVILNEARSDVTDVSIPSNPAHLAARCPVPILAVLPHFSEGDLLQSAAFLRMAGEVRGAILGRRA